MHGTLPRDVMVLRIRAIPLWSGPKAPIRTAGSTLAHRPAWDGGDSLWYVIAWACGNDPDCSHAEPLGHASALRQFKANRHWKGRPVPRAVFPPIPVHFLCRTASSATGSRLHGTRCDGVSNAESQFLSSCDFGVACLVTTDRHLASTYARVSNWRHS